MYVGASLVYQNQLTSIKPFITTIRASYTKGNKNIGDSIQIIEGKNLYFEKNGNISVQI